MHHETFAKFQPSPETHGFHDEVVVTICTDLHRLLVRIMVEHIRSWYHMRITQDCEAPRTHLR